jgi:hypothetical protein
MFTAVLNEAVLGEAGGCIKDETLMSSLKLQVDPLVSAFNVILSGTTNETTVHSKNLLLLFFSFGNIFLARVLAKALDLVFFFM